MNDARRRSEKVKIRRKNQIRIEQCFVNGICGGVDFQHSQRKNAISMRRIEAMNVMTFLRFLTTTSFSNMPAAPVAQFHAPAPDG